MDERRRRSRTALDTQLRIKRLDGTSMQEEDITVTNVSSTGIGFLCADVLENGSVYEGTLTIWTKEKFPVYLRIVRAREVEDHFEYGAMFVGLANEYAMRISVYQTVEHTKEEM